MTDVKRVVGRIPIMPQFLRRARVHSPDVVRSRDVKNAVAQNRRRLDRLILPRLEAPYLLELADIFRSDLSKTGVPPARIVAVKGEPAILRERNPGGQCKHPKRTSHFSESRNAKTLCMSESVYF